ncbi:hypothetical protein L6164_033267 [Bauhinia variegata]|uniref:Uncharacterized protein n=1 Tax=Bauhinia variegata TaxID=167791 RepID=A0ACB9KRC6_BAUVA|nr:hypothetical protein L6164_033267 [Bauhinia variegata]
MCFEGCDSLREIPDLSEVPNLKELHIQSCMSLFKIHDSVGLFKKLETLSARDCINLFIFPCAINLPSLKDLDLLRCKSLKRFPEVLEENNNELSLSLGGTAIEELPSSIQKLLGLKDIFLNESESLNRVPGGILKLSQLQNFHAESCKNINFFESSECEEAATSSEPEDLVVNLTDSGLNDEILASPAFISSLYQVTNLCLRGSSFTVLPASFKECHSLRALYLDYCKELQEIEGFPPNVLTFSAMECSSLSSQSSRMLLDQAVLKTNRTFNLPGQGVPEWFHYSSNAAKLTFWFREQVPAIAFCFVARELQPDDIGQSVDLRISVQIHGLSNHKSNYSSMFIPDGITDFDEEGMEDLERKKIHLELDLNNPPPVGDDELSAD